MSVNIPFFDDLPSKAIKPACRLWDAMMSAGYNGVVAYNDFVNDLARAGIAAPPRGVVRRWKAAVELGLVQRPAPASEVAPLPMQVPAVPAEPEVEAEVRQPYSPSGKAKAERKHRDKAQKTTVDVVVAHPETGEPVQPVVSMVMDDETREITSVAVDDGSAEAIGMENGLDDLGVRPMEAAFKGVQFSPVIDNAEALLDAVAAELNAVLIPGQPARMIVDNGAAFVAMKTAAGRLLEENIIQLSREIEHTARETTARMLREVAAELEGGAA